MFRGAEKSGEISTGSTALQILKGMDANQKI